MRLTKKDIEKHGEREREGKVGNYKIDSGMGREGRNRDGERSI